MIPLTSKSVVALQRPARRWNTERPITPLFAPLPFKLSRQMLARHVRRSIGDRAKVHQLCFQWLQSAAPRCVQLRGRAGQDALCGKAPVFRGKTTQKALIRVLRADAAVVLGSSVGNL